MPTPGQLALIHVARKQLGMEEADYRALLMRVAGVDSAEALDRRGIATVLTEFERLGFVKTPRKDAPKGAGTGTDLNRPSKAQWWLLGDLARKAGYAGFDDPRFIHWQKARSGVEHPVMLDQAGLNKLVSALRNWTRHGTTKPGKAAK
jgi:phage gp16-like protein